MATINYKGMKLQSIDECKVFEEPQEMLVWNTNNDRPIEREVCGPSLLHNALVVCSGSKRTTYTEWKVIGEDQKTGVLEVWAGGRLQRLSNGTWHYE